MQLNEVKDVYNIDIILERMEADFFTEAQHLYVLNESTHLYEFDMSGVNKLIAKGQQLVSSAKGKVDDASRQLWVNAATKFTGAGGDKTVVNGVLNHLKKHKKSYIVGAAIIATLMGGIGDVNAADMVDQAGSVMQAADAGSEISPKLVDALTGQVDGVFKATTADGFKALSGADAIQQAAEAHGVRPEEMIKHLMKNVSSQEQLVGEFKKWVGAGIKKKLGMS